MVLASSQRIAPPQEVVALRDKLVLEMLQDLFGAHGASQEGHGAQHGILCGHGEHQLTFCDKREGEVSWVATTLTRLSSHLPPTFHPLSAITFGFDQPQL
jgi:hypothetical protein